MRLLYFFLFLSALGLTSVGAAAQTFSQPGDSVAFGVGDAIRINVWEHPELGGEFEIGVDGRIIHPLYRAVRVGGRSVAGAEAEVRTVLLRLITDPIFLVEPRLRVSIGGEVGAPNIYTVAPQTSIINAVTQAGGPTPIADVKRARILRGGGVIYVDLTRPHTELAEVRLRSGDQVILDARTNVWREYVSPVLTAAGSVASITFLILRLTGQF